VVAVRSTAARRPRRKPTAIIGDAEDEMELFGPGGSPAQRRNNELDRRHRDTAPFVVEPASASIDRLPGAIGCASLDGDPGFALFDELPKLREEDEA
jgi:hypothetical protein